MSPQSGRRGLSKACVDRTTINNKSQHIVTLFNKEHFDGFSIGSNDLTQLTLGRDRDSGDIAHLFDERNEAVKILLHQAISACRSAGKYVGICGQGPSDHPDFARWLMDEGIESVSLNPDSIVPTWLYLAGQETG